MCDYDGEYLDVYDTKQVKARKEHRCGSCGRTIQPGEIYTQINWVWEGKAGVEKQCSDCKLVSDRFNREHNTYPLPSDLPDALHECILEEPDTASMWGPMLEGIKARGL